MIISKVAFGTISVISWIVEQRITLICRKAEFISFKKEKLKKSRCSSSKTFWKCKIMEAQFWKGIADYFFKLAKASLATGIAYPANGSHTLRNNSKTNESLKKQLTRFEILCHLL